MGIANNYNFGLRLRQARKKMGLTQMQLATVLGLASVSVQQYELNKRTPNLTTLYKIADALGVSISFLSGEKHQTAGYELAVEKWNNMNPDIPHPYDSTSFYGISPQYLSGFLSAHPAFVAYLASLGYNIELDQSYRLWVRDKDNVQYEFDLDKLEFLRKKTEITFQYDITGKLTNNHDLPDNGDEQ